MGPPALIDGAMEAAAEGCTYSRSLVHIFFARHVGMFSSSGGMFRRAREP